MRISRLLNTAVLSALVATSAALYAQDEKPQEAKPPRQEEPRPEAKQDDIKPPKQEKQDMKPAQQEKQDQMKPAQQGDMKPDRPQEEAKPSKEEEKAQKAQQKQQEKEQKEQMKHNQKAPAAQNGNEARPAAQGNAPAANAVGHPKGKSARIPDQQFKSSFGKSHTFVVQRTTVVEGQPGFVYSGVNFIFLDPWPTEWVYTDDCYVDYIDGEYFLFNVLHPGIRIALFVVL